jgi:hypothetical protein
LRKRGGILGQTCLPTGKFAKLKKVIESGERGCFKMNVLLVLDNDDVRDVRVMVTLTKKEFKDEVMSLLEEGRGREAFDILKSRAEVQAYFPRGEKLQVMPEVTLFEDML